jgi:hypothetical protein
MFKRLFTSKRKPTKNIEVCDAIWYEINCAENEESDIRCGGPLFLGYEFPVSPDETEKDITAFLKTCLQKYHRPCLNISTRVRQDFPVAKLWSKEKMENCIKENKVC